MYEVSGGTWQRRGAAWTNSVFAYNVSVGCNHCADPACASACPVDAYEIRDDGIVWLDSKKCIGCEYCAWVCPYSAPQYSPDLGLTTKCDFCMDLIDQGLPPACVAACPMRALEFTKVDEAELDRAASSGILPLWEIPATEHPFPLPAASRTRPHVAVKPHPAMFNAQSKEVANREEIRPGDEPTPGRILSMGDLSLVIFTLLGQTAAGAAIVSWLLGAPLDRRLLSTIGILAAMAAIASLFHLGRPLRAWRAPSHAEASPLSREVIALTGFGAAWLVALFAPGPGHVALAATGVVLIYSMAEVYRVDPVPAWNTWRTHAWFAIAAILLGLSAAMLAVARPLPAWAPVMAAAIAVQVFVSRLHFYARRANKVM